MLGMVLRVPDTVYKLLATASCSSYSCSVRYFWNYCIFSARTYPQLWCPTDRFFTMNLFSRGAKLVPGESLGLGISSFVLVISNPGSIKCREGKANSFFAAEVAADGRKVRFATAMVPDMKECDTALQTWTHACCLIGDPRCSTLGVAFMSKATKPTVKAVKKISQLLSKTRSGSCAVAEKHGSSADGQVHAVERANLQLQSATEEFPGAGMLTGKPSGGRTGAQADARGSREDADAEGLSDNIPLTGCVASAWAEEFGTTWRMVSSASSLELSVDSGAKKMPTNNQTLLKVDPGAHSKGNVWDLQNEGLSLGYDSQDALLQLKVEPRKTRHRPCYHSGLLHGNSFGIQLSSFWGPGGLRRTATAPGKGDAQDHCLEGCNSCRTAGRTREICEPQTEHNNSAFLVA